MSGDPGHGDPTRPPDELGRTTPGETPAPDVLVVCTANVARSPLLAVRLQREADRRLGPDRVVVGSAGTDARFGDPAAPGSRRIAERWGSSLDAHGARSVMYVPLGAVPLILAMTRRHVRELCAREPGLAASTFTVMEFAACLERLGAGPPPVSPSADHHEFRARLELVVRLADDRRPAHRWLRRGLDVSDPIGRNPATYERLGDRFVAVGELMAGTLFGPPPS